jgi:hypothetical protein
MGSLDPEPGPDSQSGSGSRSKMTHKNRLRLLYDFLALKNDANIPSKCNEQNTKKKKIFFVGKEQDPDE